MQNITEVLHYGGKAVDVVGLTGSRSGPTWTQQVLPRRRHQRARRRGAAALRRAQFARDRRRRDADHDDPGDDPRHDRRILPRGRSTACCRASSSCCGPIRRCCSASRSASSLQVGGLSLGLVHAAGRLADGARGDHRRRLHPLRRRSRSARRWSTLREREFIDAARQQGLGPVADHGRRRSCRTSPRRSSSSSR